MKNAIAAALCFAFLSGTVFLLLVAPGMAKEDRCADARRTCMAWCEEHRGPDGTCQADCWKRYKRCKRTGLFIWGGVRPDAVRSRCVIPCVGPKT